jgi:hypothetical protein
VRQKAGEASSKHDPNIQWALREFGGRSAAELELLTTIVYADREAAQRKEQLSAKRLARQVGEINPRLPEQHILEKIEELSRLGLLLPLSSTVANR